MDTLYQLLCAPKGPTLTNQDLNNGNYNQFLEKSMKSSQSLYEDHELKIEASHQMAKLLSSKSHSASNTLKIIKEMFEEASKTCHHERDRALIDWLQTCVYTAVEFGLDPTSAEAKISEKPKVSNGKGSSDRGVTQSKTKKKTNSSKPVRDHEEEDSEWDDEEYGYDRIGESDDDYVPTDDDEGVVPAIKKKLPGRKTSATPASPPAKKTNGGTKKTSTSGGGSSTDDTKKTKVSRKKKSDPDDQVVPTSSPGKNEATIPIVPEGAGAKALTKYFNDIPIAGVTSSSADILPNGYFTRAFFFPSKDSFNAFISVLNSAQRTIDICVFAFTDDDVANALIAAKKRNVKIQIITDNQQAAGKGADAKRLQESYGIPFKTDNTTGYMHNKFAIIDSKTLINGSFNWSKGARFKNRENVLITNIPQCIKEYQSQFDSLWKEF